jgi:hypothetical protein
VLGALIPMQPRVDPLVTELIGAATAAPDDGVKFATLKALCEVLSRAGKLVGESQKAALSGLIHQTLLEGRGIPKSHLNLQYRTNRCHGMPTDVFAIKVTIGGCSNDIDPF